MNMNTRSGIWKDILNKQRYLPNYRLCYNHHYMQISKIRHMSFGNHRHKYHYIHNKNLRLTIVVFVLDKHRHRS